MNFKFIQFFNAAPTTEKHWQIISGLSAILLIMIIGLVFFLVGKKESRDAASVSVIPLKTGLSRQVSAYVPYWEQKNAFESLKKHKDAISIVHPVWYTPENDGDIAGFPNAGDKELIDFARSNNIKIIPSINNECKPSAIEDILRDQNKIADHVSKIMAVMKENNYDGIDIDYECLEDTGLRNNFSIFISTLSDQIHAQDKYLTVAVHGKKSDTGNWSGPDSQDWAVIGDKADIMLIMALDYHWGTSEAGDIAPLSWINEILSYAKTVADPKKISLDINFYGYDWIGKTGQDIVYQEVSQLINEYQPETKISGEQEKYFS